MNSRCNFDAILIQSWCISALL